MKIALCLSGHLRNFEYTFPSLQYALQHKDVDIFIHTWDKLGFSCPYKTDATLNDTSTKLSQINNLYKPKKIIIESSQFVEDLKRQGDQYAPHLKNEPKHVGHMAGMFYKIYAANELRKSYQIETGIQYDWIIRSRPDLMFSSIINFPNDNKVWLPRGSSNPGWYNDQFAIAQSNEMDLYSSVFFDMPVYFKARMEFYPEKFLVWALQRKNLAVEWLDINFHIHR